SEKTSTPMRNKTLDRALVSSRRLTLREFRRGVRQEGVSLSATKASMVRTSILAVIAAALTLPAGPAQFNDTNAAIYSPSVTAGVASLNWAGYAYTGDTYNSVHASWVQPAADCSSGQA